MKLNMLLKPNIYNISKCCQGIATSTIKHLYEAYCHF